MHVHEILWYHCPFALPVTRLQLYKGKEADAVNDMLPYLRLANVNDPLDLPSVSFAQGPICTVSGTHMGDRALTCTNLPAVGNMHRQLRGAGAY